MKPDQQERDTEPQCEQANVVFETRLIKRTNGMISPASGRADAIEYGHDENRDGPRGRRLRRPAHIDAVRRLGYVDVVAIAASNEASAREKAAALGVPKAYGDFEALIADPDVHVVHNATPNYLHYRVNAAAIAHGKHIISDKPLAMTADEAGKLVAQAKKAGVVHAVTFNYRGNPLVQQARQLIARGDIGRPHFVHGQYLQDWLLKDTDYSWRLEPDRGGASSALGDIGSHWCDLAERDGSSHHGRARRPDDGDQGAQEARRLASLLSRRSPDTEARAKPRDGGAPQQLKKMAQL